MRAAALTFICMLLCQCTWLQTPSAAQAPKPSFQINRERYDALQPRDAHILIDLASQHAVLLNEENQTVILTDISTGKPGHSTPTGKFKVLEKLEHKQSNRYGKYIHAKTGKELGMSWTFDKAPADATYSGLDMPYWMRLTYSGVGMHTGYVEPRQTLSFGCIRVPPDVQPLIYEKCRIGTRVNIISSRLRAPTLPTTVPQSPEG